MGSMQVGGNYYWAATELSIHSMCSDCGMEFPKCCLVEGVGEVCSKCEELIGPDCQPSHEENCWNEH